MKATKTFVRYPEETDTFWNHHNKNLKISGLSRQDYCRQNKVNYARFSYWLCKQTTQTPSLIPLALKPETRTIPAAPTLCTLSLNNGYDLKIHDLPTLSFLLERFK